MHRTGRHYHHQFHTRIYTYKHINTLTTSVCQCPFLYLETRPYYRIISPGLIFAKRDTRKTRCVEETNSFFLCVDFHSRSSGRTHKHVPRNTWVSALSRGRWADAWNIITVQLSFWSGVGVLVLDGMSKRIERTHTHNTLTYTRTKHVLKKNRILWGSLAVRCLGVGWVSVAVVVVDDEHTEQSIGCSHPHVYQSS